MTRLLEGKKLAQGVTAGVREAAAHFEVTPHLVAVTASDDPATAVYLGQKARQAGKLGLSFSVRKVGAGCTQHELEAVLRAVSADPAVHGVTLELPLAPGLDADRALLHLAPEKDVEGLTPANLALVAAGREPEALLPPTPRSVRFLLREVLDLRGARVAIIGPGRTVGRPLAWMLNNRGATVTLCNQHTRDLKEVLALQDAVVVAVGRAGLIGVDQLQPHHIIVDAGINVTPEGVVGDVDPQAKGFVRALTPVPGGVGPLTSALMFQNLVRALKIQRGEPVE